jgi:uracil DNA glycosylase
MHPLFSSLWDGQRSRASVVSLLGLVFHPTDTWPLLVASLADVLPSLSRQFSLKDALPPLSLWSSLVDALPMLLLEARLDFFEWMLRHQGLLLFNKNVTVEIKKDSSHKDESKYYLRPRKKNAIHSVTF